MIQDSEEWRAARNEKLLEWVGDQAAVNYLLDMGEVIEVWDDLIDKDKPLSDERINNVFYILTIKLPQNPFYVAYHQQLTPYLEASYNSFLDSVELEKGSEQDKMFAYVLRFNSLEWAMAVIRITRGREIARKLSMEVRRFFAMYESFDEYVEKLQ